LNLKTLVEHARRRVCACGWQGATTLHAGACKEEQRSQTRAQTRKRGRSGLTFRVSVNEATNVSSHTAFRGVKERSTEVFRLNIREGRRVAVIVDDMRLGKGGWRDLPDPFQHWASEADQDVLEEA